MQYLEVRNKNDMMIRKADIPKPRPIDALVRVSFTGICGTDIQILRGESTLFTKGVFAYPTRIGHEWSGVVEEVGKQVDTVRTGDRVVSHSGVSCGECEFCIGGRWHLCRDMRAIGTSHPCWPGAFSQYMCLPAWHLHKIPDNVGMEEAALVEPVSIAQRGLRKDLTTKSVLVLGTGPIGLSAAALAKCYGSPLTIVGGIHDAKLAAAHEVGADACVNTLVEDVAACTRHLTNGKGADIVVEASGVPAGIPVAVQAAAVGGCVRMVSFYGQEVQSCPMDEAVSKAITLLGGAANGIGGFEESDMDEILGFMAAGKLRLSSLITHVFPFEQAVDVMKSIDRYDQTRIKILIKSCDKNA